MTISMQNRSVNFIRLIGGLILIASVLMARDDEGLEHYKNRNFDRARQYYESILQQKEDNPDAEFGLGSSAFQQGDVETALRAFEQALNTDDPGLKSKAFYNLGNSLYQQKKYEESLACYKKALQYDPSDRDAKYNYELLKYQQKPPQKQGQQGDRNKDKKEQETSDQEQNQKNKQSQENQDQSGKPDQQQQQEQQNKDQSQSSENQNREQQRQEKESSQEQQDSERQSKQEQRDQNQQQASQADKENASESQDKLNAQAILDALKDDEKILRKRQILHAKSRKLEKDW